MRGKNILEISQATEISETKNDGDFGNLGMVPDPERNISLLAVLFH